MVADDRELRISTQAQKFILSLPPKQRTRIREAVEKLLRGDFAGLDVKKLAPYPRDYRLRIGTVRILFHADASLLFIFKAGYRGGVYK